MIFEARNSMSNQKPLKATGADPADIFQTPAEGKLIPELGNNFNQNVSTQIEFPIP